MSRFRYEIKLIDTEANASCVTIVERSRNQNNYFSIIEGSAIRVSFDEKLVRIKAKNESVSFDMKHINEMIELILRLRLEMIENNPPKPLEITTPKIEKP